MKKAIWAAAATLVVAASIGFTRAAGKQQWEYASLSVVNFMGGPMDGSGAVTFCHGTILQSWMSRRAQDEAWKALGGEENPDAETTTITHIALVDLLGVDGWEMVCTEAVKDQEALGCTFYFKRPK